MHTFTKRHQTLQKKFSWCLLSHQALWRNHTHKGRAHTHSCMRTVTTPRLRYRTCNSEPTMAVEVTVDVMIRGYQVYRGIWSAVVDEQLTCKRESFNSADPFAVALMKGDTTVGHVFRKICSICSLFLQQNGTILCRVIGTQGDLEIPCTLTFQGSAGVITKVSQLFQSILSLVKNTPLSPPSKGRKIDPDSEKTTISQESKIQYNLAVLC